MAKKDSATLVSDVKAALADDEQKNAEQGPVRALLIDILDSVNPISTGAVADDDNAATSGTAVNVVQEAAGVSAYLVSTLANNADVLAEVGDGGPTVKINDSDSPGGVQLYFDEDSTSTDERFIAASPDGADIRVPLSDGTYIMVKHDPLAGAIAQVEDLDTPADSSGSLDGTYFQLSDEDGTVGVWIDVDDSGTTIPGGASALDRAIEVTGVATDDIDSAVATAVASAIDGDGKFSATSDGATVTVTHATAGAVGDAADGDAGITGLSVTTDGSDANGVAVYADDDSANAHERLLFVSPTNAAGSYTTDDSVF